MTEAMPFLQKYDITFLRPPLFTPGALALIIKTIRAAAGQREKPRPGGRLKCGAAASRAVRSKI